jgi:C1A family cysteine protease
MHRSYMIISLVFILIAVLSLTSIDVSANQTSSGIIWQAYSLDNQDNWHLESTGQNLTQTRSSLATDSSGLIDQPSLLIFRGRIPALGLTLHLDANITVGATWDLIGSPDNIAMEIIDFVPYSNLSGTPGRMSVLITSSSAEIQDVQLNYHRPWLTDEKPKRKLIISSDMLPQSIDLSHEIEIAAPPSPAISAATATGENPDLALSPSVLPADFDWRDVGSTNYVTPVRDQELCGSCWAHAIIGATESALLIDGIGFDPSTLDLSEQYLVSCRTDALNAPCGGWNSSSNAYHLDKYGQLYNPPGAVLESSFPYAGDSISCGFGAVQHPYKIASYTYVGDGMTWSPHNSDPAVKRSNIELIKTALHDHGPVGAGMYVRINLCESSSCDPYVEPPEALGSVNHDILIVGWHDDGDLDFTDDYWIVKNSFGPTWHSNGYFNISFEGPVIGTGAYYVDFTPGKYRGDLSDKVYIPLTTKNVPGTAGIWVTLLDEDFEGVFPGTKWRADNGGAELPYYWGQTDCEATTPGGHSLWWVGAGGTPLSCGANYPKGINTSAYYGPIDLTNATSAYMKFKLWTNTLPTYQFIYYDPLHPEWGGYYTPDFLLFGAGPADDIYSVWSIRYPGDIYGSSSGWREMVLDLSNLDSSGFEEVNMLNRSNVYLYFGAVSHDHPNAFDDYSEGIYIDDVIVKKCVGGTCTLDW